MKQLVAMVALISLTACGRSEVCREGQNPRPQPLQPLPGVQLHPYAHAHNDYEHERPLLDALDARFYSVEADVFFSDGRFEVSHGGLSGSKGTLQELYLDPLQALVTARGSVHGDSVPFTLWIDFKDNHPNLPASLEALLAKYPMFTSFEGDVRTEGPVNVILTGNSDAKEAYAALATRHAVRDSNDYSLEDPPADSRWGAYALSWGSYLGWNGSGEPSEEDSKRLACIVENAHANGRKVRFYGAPDRLEVWKAMVEHGVDFIHTDKLEELNGFLANYRR